MLQKRGKQVLSLALSTAMAVSGMPAGAGMVSYAATQYEVQEGEIPEAAASLEDLPSIVNCVEVGAAIQTPKNISWEVKSGSFYDAGSVVSVVGTIEENHQKVEASIIAAPDSVVYLVDSNVKEPEDSADYQRFLENGDTDDLKNETPDQEYTQGEWGYTSSLSSDMSAKGKVAALAKTKNETGYYAKNNKSISYKLALDEGTYTAAGSIAEWWGGYSRSVDMNVTYVDEDGATQTVKLANATLGNQNDTKVLAGSFTLDEAQDVTLSFSKKSGTGSDAVLSGFTIMKVDEELPKGDQIEVTLDGEKVDPVNTFGGFGSVTCNNTSRLLLDYKALHPDEYWKMMHLLFDKEGGAGLNHVKIEMGADVNSSSGTEPATMRSPDEEPNVRRGAGFQFAADAKSINPDISVELLRWGEPKWTQEGLGYEDAENPRYEARYQWFRKTIDAAYETYGLKITEVSPGQNERRKDYDDDFAWIKYCAKRFDEDGENGVGAFDYRDIKIVAADLYRGMDTTVNYLMKDSELRDLVDVISDHYEVWSGSENLKKLNEEYGKEIWYGESIAPMINANYRANVDPDLGGLGGSASIISLAERFIAAYAYKNDKGYANHMTELLFQPAIGAFYEGSAYSPKQLIGAFDPWSGYFEADGGIQMVQHFMEFADNDWQYLEEACFSDGKTGDGDITAGTSTDTRLALKDPDTDDYSVIFANNTAEERVYRLNLKNLKTKDAAYNVWETAGPKDGEAYDANWFQKVVSEQKPLVDANGDRYINLTVKPYTIVTLTSLTDRGTEYESGQNDSGMEREVLSLPYRDDYNYDDSFVEERGGTPLFSTDLEGAFEVEPAKDGGYALTQVINDENRPYNWNPWGSGSDESSQTTGTPWTVLGDHRWANYTAGVDFKLDTSSDGYGSNFAVLGVRELVHSSGAAYRAKIYESGKWELLRYNTVKKSGTIADFDANDWHKLQLEADENVITLYLDGEEISTFTDEASIAATGRVTLMSGFWNTQFDNLEVLPIEGKAAYADEKLDDTDEELTFTGNVNHKLNQVYAHYNRTLTDMPAGSSVEFTIPDGVGFDILGASGSAKIQVEVDGNVVADNISTKQAGNRETSYWNEDLGDGSHEVKVSVQSGTLTVDGINLFAQADEGNYPVNTEELSRLIETISQMEFDPEAYPQSLIEALEAQIEASRAVLAEAADQKSVDLSALDLKNALEAIVPSDTIVDVSVDVKPMATYQSTMPDLPKTAKVTNAAGQVEEKEITWDVSEEDFDTTWQTVTVTGSVEGVDKTFSTKVIVVPFGLKQFIDSGTAQVTNGNGEAGYSEAYDIIASSIDLENDRADQVYTEGSWGYVPSDKVTIKGGASYESGIFDTGLYVDYNNKTEIVYKLPVAAGSWQFSVGAQAYWSETHSGDLAVRYTDADGKTVEQSLGTITVSASDNNKVVTSEAVEIPTAQTIEFVVKATNTKIHLISWLAVSESFEVENPALATEAEEVPQLPETVLVNGEEQEVTWKEMDAEDFAQPWTTVKVTGKTQENIPVVATIDVIAKNLKYFIDAGVTDQATSSYYERVSEAADLENDAPDQLYEAGSWGYDEAEALGGMRQDTDDIYERGWYAKKDKEIVYKLPLEAGTYAFTSGYYEWWYVTRPMEAYVTFENEDGEEQSVSLGTITISEPKNYRLDPKTEVTIPTDQVVTFHVKKTGNSDPVISWLAVNKTADKVWPVKKIEIAQEPIKTVYELGEELDLEGLVVVATFQDGSTRELTSDEYEVEAFDSSEVGRQKVVIRYTDEEGNEVTAKFKVNVYDPDALADSAIRVVKEPEKTVYEAGEEFDPTGMEIRLLREASPSNAAPARAEVLDESSCEYEYDFSEPGDQKVTVRYLGMDADGEDRELTDTVDVTVIERADDYYQDTLVIGRKPQKTVYEVGEELDTDKMQVLRVMKASASNAVRTYTEELADDAYEVETDDFDEAGTYTVTVSNTGIGEDGAQKTFEAHFNVTVTNDRMKVTDERAELAKKEAEEIFGGSDKKFRTEEELKNAAEDAREKLAGLELCEAEETISDTVMQSIEQVESYFTQAFANVRVKITGNAALTENMSVAGAALAADGAKDALAKEVDVHVTKADLTQEIKEELEDRPLVGMGLTVLVNDEEKALEIPVKVSMEVPAELFARARAAKSENDLYLVSADGELTKVPATFAQGRVEFIATKTGTYVIAGKKQEKEDPQKALTHIEITALPDRTSYRVGQKLDTEGLVVTAFYEDATSLEVTDYTISGDSFTKAGEKTITVTYQDQSATFTVWVRKNSTSSLGGYSYTGPQNAVANEAGTWRQDAKGWWYQLSNGGYPAARWSRINGRWYYFNAEGYMLTGWVQLNNKWYYLNADGSMAESTWVQYKDRWYYLNADGSMAANQKTPDGYWIGSDGSWTK